jgi:hypothetical protein
VVVSKSMRVSELDVADIPAEWGTNAVPFVVLGTVLYEPVPLALRRIAQTHVSAAGQDGPSC